MPRLATMGTLDRRHIVTQVSKTFAYDVEITLMGGQTQEDQIGIHTIQTMSRVRIPKRPQPLLSHPMNNFMLSFACHARIGEDDGEVLPSWVKLESTFGLDMEGRRNLRHEGS